MNHYHYTQTLHELWETGLRLYKNNERTPARWFNAEQQAWLAGIGMNSQELFDFVEDFLNSGEPDFTTVALIQDVRRAYFFQEQKGIPSDTQIDMDQLPAKTDAVADIVWLPRILPKARAKLQGEMPAELMFNCGGDRRFFKTHDIHPAEFLRIVWQHWNDDNAVIAWVQARSASMKS